MLTNFKSLLLPLGLGLAAGMASAAETPPAALLVLNKGDNTLAIVDPVSLQVVGRAPAGADPHEVIASADGHLAFISNYGAGHTLSVVDLTTQQAQPPVELGALHSPHGLALADGKIYFTAEASKVIGRYDPTAHQIDWILGLGQDRTHMIVVSKDAREIFTSNVNSDTISLIEKRTESRGGFGGPPPGPGPGGPPPDGGPSGPPPNDSGSPLQAGPTNASSASGLAGPGGPAEPVTAGGAVGPGGPGNSGNPGSSMEAGGLGRPGPGGFPPGGPGGFGQPDWSETHVAVGHGPEGFDVSPDGRELWAANSHAGTVSIIDIAKKQVVQTMSVPTRSANRLKFTPDGTMVLISDLGSRDLVIMDVASRKEIKRLQLGGGSAGILMQPDGARAYVAVGSDNGVTIIDLKTLQIAGHINTGPGPDGLAWAVRN